MTIYECTMALSASVEGIPGDYDIQVVGDDELTLKLQPHAADCGEHGQCIDGVQIIFAGDTIAALRDFLNFKFPRGSE